MSQEQETKNRLLFDMRPMNDTFATVSGLLYDVALGVGRVEGMVGGGGEEEGWKERGGCRVERGG